MKKNTYELRKNKFGTFFIKNNKYYYLKDFDIWGLDTTLWFDKIDYYFYKVKFIKENNKTYINIRKTQSPIKNI